MPAFTLSYRFAIRCHCCHVFIDAYWPLIRFRSIFAGYRQRHCYAAITLPRLIRHWYTALRHWFFRQLFAITLRHYTCWLTMMLSPPLITLPSPALWLMPVDTRLYCHAITLYVSDCHMITGHFSAAITFISPSYLHYATWCWYAIFIAIDAAYLHCHCLLLIDGRSYTLSLRLRCRRRLYAIDALANIFSHFHIFITYCSLPLRCWYWLITISGFRCYAYYASIG